MVNKTIVIIPTYNEKGNIDVLIKNILSLNIRNLEILVVDDNSPDGTAEIVKKINNPKVHVLVRKGRRGRGLAGIDGFKKALELEAEYIIEMDADLSHNPEYIPLMLKEISEYDIILGSRLIAGSMDVERSLIRRSITFFSNWYVRTLFGMKIKDCNSGYRCFKRKVIESIIDNLKSDGPAIVQEVLYNAFIKKFKIKEIPIKFKQRKKGSSKLSMKQMMGGFLIVPKLKIDHIAGKI